MSWWEIFGWAGSVLVVVSLWIPSVWRFRILNLSGSLIATIYNIYFGIWPYAAMNGVIVGIDAYWIARLSRKGTTAERGYAIVNAHSQDALVQHFLARNVTDIQANYPQFSTADLDSSRISFIMHEDEIVGLFAMTTTDATGTIILDYVTPRFRDLGPGRYIYTHPSLFTDAGVSRLQIPAENTSDRGYFAKQGFTQENNHLVRSI
ncbi:hypothetical protein [Arcanobacterium phocae]|uniref:hypothetical protein n=1 Tax=Arcanobacterium phocae TaxID=131112 RepID=UPI001C10546E|nr:hypothetical protein [Arcanobacterium phocae]